MYLSIAHFGIDLFVSRTDEKNFLLQFTENHFIS